MGTSKHNCVYRDHVFIFMNISIVHIVFCFFAYDCMSANRSCWTARGACALFRKNKEQRGSEKEATGRFKKCFVLQSLTFSGCITRQAGIGSISGSFASGLDRLRPCARFLLVVRSLPLRATLSRSFLSFWLLWLRVLFVAAFG